MTAPSVGSPVAQPIPIARPSLGTLEEQAVSRVIRSGRLAQGEEVAAFEHEFAAMCGAAHAVACMNGTAALQLALLAHGVGPGDEVVIPAFTFAATANAVVSVGAEPVFCDVSEGDFCIDPSSAASVCTTRTRVVMPVHLYGQVAPMEAVREVAKTAGATVIEDACQAHGAGAGARRAGSFATAAFSFYATKNMTTGEGGMVTAQDEGITSRLRLLRNHGMEQRYVHTTFGLNLRMTEIQAAIGRVQLAALPQRNARRAEIAGYYTDALAGVEGVVLPSVRDGATHVWHQYTVRITGGRRDEVLARLRANGVGADVYYPTPVHMQQPFRRDGVDLPVAERLAGEVLSLPIYPDLSDDECRRVAETLVEAL